MLYICIPTFDEAPTIGVLLWRIRRTFQEFPREYEILVCDDGSTDQTLEVLEPYRKALPLTIIEHAERRGYAAAIDSLCRAAAARTRYPRRDAVVLMQADFTDQPEHIPELVKRFEGGADLVVAERSVALSTQPVPVRRLSRVAPWVLRPFVRVPGVRDPLGSFRLIRVSVIRDLIRSAGDSPIVTGDGWAANIDLLLRAAPLARRVETVPADPRYDVRPRESRIRPFAGAMNLYRFARAARGRRLAAAPSAPA